MLANFLVAFALVLPSSCSFLQFYENQTSHLQPARSTVGVSNVPDLISRALQMGIFDKEYVPPPFLTFKSKAPNGNLFVYVANYDGKLEGSKVSFEVDGHARISHIFAGSNSAEEASSSLPDLVSAHFQARMVCGSHCPNLAAALCGHRNDLVAPSPTKLDADFVSKFNIPAKMPTAFVLEMQFLSQIKTRETVAVFFGVSSLSKVPNEMRVDAKRVLEAVIADVSQQMPPNSLTEVLTMNGAFHHDKGVPQVSHASRRRLLATTGGLNYLPGEWLAQIWISVGGFFVVVAIAYYLAYMDYTQDSVLYTTMNPNLADRRR